MHASVNVGCEGKSGPGKIHEVILVLNIIIKNMENSLKNGCLVIFKTVTAD